jgi:hypothetical protein
MRLYILIFAILSCVGGLQKLSAQDAFASNRLNELFALLPLECKNALSRSTESKCLCAVKGNTLPIKAAFNSHGQLTHLGLDMFSFDANLIYPNTVLSFIERSFLEYFVWNDAGIIERKNKEDKIVLFTNGKQFNTPGAEKLAAMLPVLLSDVKELDIMQDSLYYQATIKSPKGKASLLFAANYQVVSGMDKREYAHQLVQALKGYTAKNNIPIAVNAVKLKPYQDNLYVNIGKSYFKTISSNTYFNCLGNNCQPVFNAQYPLESFTNAFLTVEEYNRNIRLSIEQKIYGNEKENYTVNLADFVAYFNNDYELYFGLENNNEKLLDGTLIIFNRQLNFINLLYVSSDPKEFFKEGPRTLNAKFYTNIPADNIKNLFAERVEIKK